MQKQNDQKTGHAAGKHHETRKDSEKHHGPNESDKHRKHHKHPEHKEELIDFVHALFLHADGETINKQLIEMLGMAMAHESLNEFPDKRDNLCLTIQKLQQFINRIEPFTAK